MSQSEVQSKSKKLPAIVILTIAVAGGGYFAYDDYMYVKTDNASIQAATTLISSKVSGIITDAIVQENQKVKMGDVLIEIKPDDYKNSLDQLNSEKASLHEQLKGAEISYRRALDLFKQGASTQERLDSATTQYRSLEAKMKSAEAQAATAQSTLGYTKITAPADGKVGRKSFEVGMLAAPGQPLFGFVAGNERWVVANLKETDMDRIKAGEKVSVTVDAIKGHAFEGEVESISPTVGATFSLLPPDNATGNFTKVIQRVPVRIKLLHLTDTDAERLQAGLSAEVKITTR